MCLCIYVFIYAILYVSICLIVLALLLILCRSWFIYVFRCLCLSLLMSFARLLCPSVFLCLYFVVSFLFVVSRESFFVPSFLPSFLFSFSGHRLECVEHTTRAHHCLMFSVFVFMCVVQTAQVHLCLVLISASLKSKRIRLYKVCCRCCSVGVQLRVQRCFMFEQFRANVQQWCNCVFDVGFPLNLNSMRFRLYYGAFRK